MTKFPLTRIRCNVDGLAVIYCSQWGTQFFLNWQQSCGDLSHFLIIPLAKATVLTKDRTRIEMDMMRKWKHDGGYRGNYCTFYNIFLDYQILSG